MKGNVQVGVLVAHHLYNVIRYRVEFGQIAAKVMQLVSTRQCKKAIASLSNRYRCSQISDYLLLVIIQSYSLLVTRYCTQKLELGTDRRGDLFEGNPHVSCASRLLSRLLNPQFLLS